MKKVLFVLIAFATLSFTACSSGGNKTEKMDSTEMNQMQQDVTNAVKDSANTMMDTAKMNMADTTKKM